MIETFDSMVHAFFSFRRRKDLQRCLARCRRSLGSGSLGRPRSWLIWCFTFAQESTEKEETVEVAMGSICWCQDWSCYENYETSIRIPKTQKANPKPTNWGYRIVKYCKGGSRSTAEKLIKSESSRRFCNSAGGEGPVDGVGPSFRSKKGVPLCCDRTRNVTLGLKLWRNPLRCASRGFWIDFLVENFDGLDADVWSGSEPFVKDSFVCQVDNEFKQNVVG